MARVLEHLVLRIAAERQRHLPAFRVHLRIIDGDLVRNRLRVDRREALDDMQRLALGDSADAAGGGGPDLILLDIALPGEDGYEVLADLRADARLGQTRVIAITMRNSPEEIKRTRLAGFDGFIGKPVQAHRFPDQIRRVLAGEDVWEQ